MINKTYKVLHVLQSSLPLQSGYGIRSQYILKYQKRFCDPVAVTSPYYVPEKYKDVDVIDGVTYYRCYPGFFSRSFIGKNIPGLKYYFRSKDFKKYLSYLINLINPSIIHAHSSFQAAFPSYKVARYYKIPFIYEVRGVWEDASVAEGRLTERSLRYKLKKKLETFLIKNSDFVVTISEALKQDLITRGALEEKISVIPNGIDNKTFIHSQSDILSLKEKLGLQNSIVVGYIGNIRKYEGLDILIRSVPLVIKENQKVKFLVVGEGNAITHLRQLTNRFNIEENVSFIGEIPYSQIDQYYTLIDIFVLPRPRNKQSNLVTPLKPLKAMEMGKVVLASRLDALAELVQDGETGILFTPEDVHDLANKILFLSANIGLRKRLGYQAKYWVIRKRSWMELIDRYYRIYKRLLHF